MIQVIKKPKISQKWVLETRLVIERRERRDRCSHTNFKIKRRASDGLMDQAIDRSSARQLLCPLYYAVVVEHTYVLLYAVQVVAAAFILARCIPIYCRCRTRCAVYPAAVVLLLLFCWILLVGVLYYWCTAVEHATAAQYYYCGGRGSGWVWVDVWVTDGWLIGGCGSGCVGRIPAPLPASRVTRGTFRCLPRGFAYRKHSRCCCFWCWR